MIEGVKKDSGNRSMKRTLREKQVFQGNATIRDSRQVTSGSTLGMFTRHNRENGMPRTQQRKSAARIGPESRIAHMKKVSGELE